MLRQCAKCGNDYALIRFERRPDGTRRTWCRFCRREAAKDYQRERTLETFPGDTHAARNDVLAELGFATYGDYLKSSLWKRVRGEAFAANGGFCVLCAKPAGLIHHNRYRYRDLVGKSLQELHPVCYGCHDRIEYCNGVKRTLSGAVAEFNRLQESLIRRVKL